MKGLLKILIWLFVYRCHPDPRSERMEVCEPRDFRNCQPLRTTMTAEGSYNYDRAKASHRLICKTDDYVDEIWYLGDKTVKSIGGIGVDEAITKTSHSL